MVAYSDAGDILLYSCSNLFLWPSKNGSCVFLAFWIVPITIFSLCFYLASVTAEKWVPIIELPVNSIKHYLEKKKKEGFATLGLEQTANSTPLDKYSFPQRTVMSMKLNNLRIISEIG